LPYYRKSFSQVGEDVIVYHLLANKKEMTYLDIGANHPIDLSNTYHFYEKGYRGVLVEPDIRICEKINQMRPDDICLNIGIGFDEQEEADFYLMDNDVFNTFSKEEAEKFQNKNGFKIEDVIKVPLKNVNNIIEKYFKTCPDFVSIDTEGFEMEILKSFNFEKYRPCVFCLETWNFEVDNCYKRQDIIDFMITKDYEIFADTQINTIFKDKKVK